MTIDDLMRNVSGDPDGYSDALTEALAAVDPRDVGAKPYKFEHMREHSWPTDLREKIITYMEWIYCDPGDVWEDMCRHYEGTMTT